MTINYSGLKHELTTDPLNLGYSGALAVGDDDTLVRLLNNIGVGSGFTVWRNDIAPREVVNSVQPTDFSSLNQIQLSKLNLLFIATPIDATQSGVRANFTNVFSGMATLNSGYLTVLSQRQGSRVEVLFGDGTVVQSSDIVIALRTSG